MKPRALIVDDEPAECELVRDALSHAGFEAFSVQNPAKALELLSTQPFDVVLTDLNMPGMNGTELCRRIIEAAPHVPVVLVTAFGSIDSAVDAMRAGAYDFLTKPFDVDGVALVLRRAVEHRELKREVDALRRVVDTSQRNGSLLGTSQAMRDIYGIIERVADNDAPILITGESGTGKEVVAREIHARSRNSSGRFVALNCAAMPEALLESELFGHVRGAFTDARTPREGLLVAASGGTLLLDEIGDMPIGLQPKLLRALQERVVRPVGSDSEHPFDARIITATHRDLLAETKAGRFREDLFYRLNVLPILVPPLRDRRDDIPLLIDHFVARNNVRLGTSIRGLDTESRRLLFEYPWPGNVRELENTIERAMVLAEGDQIVAQDLPERLREARDPVQTQLASGELSVKKTMRIVEEILIRRALQRTKGNRTRAAEVLEISHRALLYKIKDYQITDL